MNAQGRYLQPEKNYDALGNRSAFCWAVLLGMDAVNSRADTTYPAGAVAVHALLPIAP